MKALSVRQPYASLIVAGIKAIENRSWAPKYRGRLAIHASKSMRLADLNDARALCREIGAPFPEEFPRGGILGTVDFTGVIWKDENGVIVTDHPTLIEIDATWWFEDAVGWILENPQACLFVPYTGKLQLFDVPDELIKNPEHK
jgi:hypothetical protein